MLCLSIFSVEFPQARHLMKQLGLGLGLALGLGLGLALGLGLGLGLGSASPKPNPDHDLSKGQLECRAELADLATRCDVTITEVHLGACTCARGASTCTRSMRGCYRHPASAGTLTLTLTLTLTQVPLFDAEVRAPPGLRAMGSAMFEASAKG